MTAGARGRPIGITAAVLSPDKPSRIADGHGPLMANRGAPDRLSIVVSTNPFRCDVALPPFARADQFV